MAGAIGVLASAQTARQSGDSMFGRLLQASLWWVLTAVAVSVVTDAPAPPAVPSRAGEPHPALAAAEKAKPAGKVTVYVVPVRDQIAQPVLYILRRGLKEAERKADVVVLDMETPGGALNVTFEIMAALEKFHGSTITFVDKEAVSAGAFISATTQEIWFAPDGVIGAAAPVTSTGQDIDETMKLKVVSYLKARVRAISEGKGYRGQVISAMIDKDYELKIGDVVIKPKGELLSLTASEAAKSYGDPPRPLLAAGIAKDIDDLLRQKFGADGYEIVQLNVTWSEQLAVWLNAIAPVLMGLGVICLFIEFKTPGFGVFGIAGVALLALVFLGHYVAGFSGHEPMIVFAIGLLLVAVEVLVFPGVAVVALSGLVLMLGSLVWAMADIWPNEPVTIAVSGDLFFWPLINLGSGLALAVILALLLTRFLPRGWIWDRMVLQKAAVAAAQVSGGAPEADAAALVGACGVVVTGLFPSGQIEIDGRRYEAKLEVGSAPPGTAVVVKRASDFNLVVETIAS
jgi:membrane-bound serine protease (ClpP class)